MKTTIQIWWSRNGLAISIYIVLAAIIIISVASIIFRNQIIRNSQTKESILAANHGLEFMNKYVNLADLGLRGYMIIPQEGFLTPYHDAIKTYQSNLDELRAALQELNYDVQKMKSAERAIQEYMQLVQEMVRLTEIGDFEATKQLFSSDPGYDAWLIYSAFERDALAHIEQISRLTDENYSGITFWMMILQVVFLLLGAPILSWAIISFRRSTKNRAELYDQLVTSNDTYIFNSGEEGDTTKDEKTIINKLTRNLRQATDFISNITRGNYDISWPGITKENTRLNNHTIAGELTTMRDQMKKVKSEDEKRIWSSQGLTDFARIIRNNQHDFKSLSIDIITNLVKYLNIQMGGLFILNEDNEDQEYLELTGCYAYNRVKTLERKVPPGKGLVGQCYLEGDTIYMKEVPQDFVDITSGLGGTRPKYVLIVPLKLNDKIEGVLELASLNSFAEHEIGFIEKLGETLASAITTVRSAESTNMLLGQMKEQAEEMRAQEEEMRQNMEELQATQEQMLRKNEEVEKLLQKAYDRESEMKKQNEIIAGEKAELETETAILNTLMEVLPERITIKDEQGRFLKLSEAKYKTLREQGYENIIGKSDRDIFGEEHFARSFAIEKELMQSKKPVMHVEEKINISKDVSIWGLTSRVPFIGSAGKVLGTIVVTADITKEKTCAEELAQLQTRT
jgi:PAS domain S-box-containing protein